jgi:hypothetical protein
VRPTSENYQFDVSVKKLKTATLLVVADATVLMSSPAMNFGEETALNLFNNEFLHERFYLQLDLDGIEATAEPADATLMLYNVWEESIEESRVILVAEILGEWQEMSVTWATGPQTTGAAIAHSTYEDRWYEVDVTTYLRDWLVDNMENLGFLVDTPVDYVAGRFIFASREYEEEDKRPHVILEYAW